jgi:2-oxoglutarate ferredoxin oxidoreductase subunit alpha
VKQLLTKEFKGKDKLIAPNFKAFELRPTRKSTSRRLAEVRKPTRSATVLSKATAAALGAVNGATFYWYPITPSTSLRRRSKYCSSSASTRQKRFAIVRRRMKSPRSAW